VILNLPFAIPLFYFSFQSLPFDGSRLDGELDLLGEPFDPGTPD